VSGRDHEDTKGTKIGTKKPWADHAAFLNEVQLVMSQKNGFVPAFVSFVPSCFFYSAG
jgi:hypothetical protein